LIIHSEIIPGLFFPTIIEEFVAQLRADSILIPAGNSWRLDAGRWLCWQTTFTLPETTHDLVSWALRNLSAEARHLLDVLAVAGQGRALLHLQAERIRACLLAASDDWLQAKACFAKTVEQATNLDLPLEIARTQACQVLVDVDHQAYAELRALKLLQ
jgi:hypothetical protein